MKKGEARLVRGRRGRRRESRKEGGNVQAQHPFPSFLPSFLRTHFFLGGPSSTRVFVIFGLGTSASDASDEEE